MTYVSVGSLVGVNAHANSRAADSTNAENLWAGGSAGLSLTGAGVTVGVWEANDSGNWEVRHTHEAFRSYNAVSGLWDGPTRVSFGDTPESLTSTSSGAYSDHGTHVAGTIGGAHTPGQESRWGMAPGVNIISFSAGSATTEIRNEFPEIDISNHSYGFNRSPWDRRDWNVSDGNGGTVQREYDTWSYDWDTRDEDPGYGYYSGTSRSVDLAMIARPKHVAFYSAGNARNDSDDRYTDVQNDGKFVTRFSSTYIANNTIIGEDLGSRYYLVSEDDYTSDLGFDPGGYDSIYAYTIAKNNVVVGAAEDYTTDPHNSNTSNIRTTSFSSYGPTDDGGLGVDLVANGAGLNSARDGSDTSYGGKSGTSMSAPNAAGTAALVLEHWRNVNGGYTPDSATQKGLLMHTATDSTRSGLVGPDYRTGYGLVNGLEAAEHISEAHQASVSTRERHAWEDTLDQNETIEIDFIATGGSVKASLSWLDPAASSRSFTIDDRTSLLVNDLDIWITDEFNNTYLTWVLDPENPNNAATRDAHNRVDNFTQVYINALAADTAFTVHINHFGSLQNGLSQDFAFFLSGATIVPEPGTAALLSLGLLGLTRRRRAA